jgi:hypothetical protein
VQSVHIGVITSNLGRPPGVTTIASPRCLRRSRRLFPAAIDL